MSRSKRKKRLKNESSIIDYIKLRLITLITLLISLLLKPLHLIMGKRDLDDPNLPQKKRERLLNKQSKMFAEYRLVVKKGMDEVVGEEEDGVEKKKIKLLGEGNNGSNNGSLGEEEFKAMKKELAERKRALIQLPRFAINATTGTTASVFQTDYSSRTPLLLSDIEHLVAYAYGGNTLVTPPSRWCSFRKPNRLNNVVVVVVDGVGLSEFVDNEECFAGCMEIFGGESINRAIVEFLSPAWYGGSLDQEVQNWGILSPPSQHQQDPPKPEDQPDGQPPPVSTPESFKMVLNQLSSVFPIKGNTSQQPPPPPEDMFPRTNLILTLPQLIQENYPLPIPSTALSKVRFEPTSDSYSPVNSCSRMFSIDCEMCVTADDPQALTRVAVVDEELGTVYETLVKPELEITDYLTRWSGITPEMMVGVSTTLGEVQGRIKEIVKEYPDCILVGQSLNCDLKALRMTHPYVADTSTIFNLTGVEGRKSKLRDLAYNLLDEEIQLGHRDRRSSRVGHCPVEDAAAAMKLVKAKLKNGFEFGNALKNPSYLRQSTKLSLDPMFTHSSFRQNKLDKSVLLVYQPQSEDASSPPPAEPSESSEPKPQPQPPHPESTLITRIPSTSNRTTLKQISTRIFEHYLSIGFYNIRPDTENLKKSLAKLNKRVSKLYNNLGSNSMFIVVCSKECERGSGGQGFFSDSSRRNNGVCFVRCKVSEVTSGRRMD